LVLRHGSWRKCGLGVIVMATLKVVSRTYNPCKLASWLFVHTKQ
jgi:hypothetical protein